MQKLYPLWHTFGVQDPTLSGTLLETPTLCGTEIGQNGTLAVLAYAYCRQWEYPPGYCRYVKISYLYAYPLKFLCIQRKNMCRCNILNLSRLSLHAIYLSTVHEKCILHPPNWPMCYKVKVFTPISPPVAVIDAP